MASEVVDLCNILELIEFGKRLKLTQSHLLTDHISNWKNMANT